MKKISYLAFTLTVMVGAASCEKITETTQLLPSGQFRDVTIAAGTPQTRTSVNNGVITWSANDKLNIAPKAGTIDAASLDITEGAGTASGTFSGQVDASITDGTELYGWCGGDLTYDSGVFTVEMPSTQTYVANGLAENAYPSIGTGTITSGITLTNVMGVFKLAVKGTSTDLVKSITVTSAANNLSGSFTINPASSYAISGGSSKTLTLNVASPYVALSSAGVNFYIVLPVATYAANDLTVTVTKSDDSTVSRTISDEVTITASNATAKNVKTVLPEGALSGEFSVSATTKVHFAKGNLRYTAATSTWDFYEHQYDFAGVYETAVVSYFTWGYHPSKSTNPSGYDIDNVSVIDGNLSQSEDWGCTIGDGETWRTLTDDEWGYLLKDRTDAASKLGYATVADVKGLIILPDTFTDPMKNGGSGAFVCGAPSQFTTNTYSAGADWNAMEAAGALFLPSAGHRYNKSVEQVGGIGCYWSSTTRGYDDYYARRLYFSVTKSGYNINTSSNIQKFFGSCVRLVCGI